MSDGRHRGWLGAAAAAGVATLSLALPAAAASVTPRAPVPSASWGTPATIPGMDALLASDGDASIQFPELQCSAPGDCTFFAYDAIYLGSGLEPEHLLVAVESSGVWGEAAIVPGTQAFSQPGGELCVSQGNCVVWFSTAALTTEVVTESAGTWAAGQVLPDPDSAQLQVFSLACPVLLDCTALGWDETGRVVTIAEDDGIWQDPVALPGLGALTNAHVAAGPSQIVCAAVSDCLVTGYLSSEVTDDTSWPFVADERAGVWSSAHTIPWVMARNKGEASIDDAACGAPGYCSVIGSYENGLQAGAPYRSEYVDFVASERDGKWGAPIALTTASWNDLGQNQGLVACPDRASCTVAGVEGEDASIAFVEGLVNGVPTKRVTYELYGSGLPAATTLLGLACPNPKSCGLALGDWNKYAGYLKGNLLVAANEVDGAWGRPHALPGWPPYSGSFGPTYGAVQCPSTFFCAVTSAVATGTDEPGPGYFLSG